MGKGVTGSEIVRKKNVWPRKWLSRRTKQELLLSIWKNFNCRPLFSWFREFDGKCCTHCNKIGTNTAASGYREQLQTFAAPVLCFRSR
jgi:hypothetical protein